MPVSHEARTAVQVRVPATTANLGPGFDTLGMALDLENTVTLESQDWCDTLDQVDLTITCSGEGERSLSRGRDNLALRVAAAAFARHGRFPRHLHLALDNKIPLARGLGSSAATTVGALLAAHGLLGVDSPPLDILRDGIAFEGHVDNVAPALLGGITLGAVRPEGPEVVRIEPPAGLLTVAAIPSFSLKTVDARRALPKTVPYADAVHNLSRTAFVWTALSRGDWDMLHWAMSDRLHEPYRARLIPGFQAVCQAALDAGAIASALSGAGPTVIAFASTDYNSASAEGIAESMEKAFRDAGVQSRCVILRPRPSGAASL